MYFLMTKEIEIETKKEIALFTFVSFLSPRCCSFPSVRSINGFTGKTVMKEEEERILVSLFHGTWNNELDRCLAFSILLYSPRLFSFFLFRTPLFLWAVFSFPLLWLSFLSLSFSPSLWLLSVYLSVNRLFWAPPFAATSVIQMYFSLLWIPLHPTGRDMHLEKESVKPPNFISTPFLSTCHARLTRVRILIWSVHLIAFQDTS